MSSEPKPTFDEQEAADEEGIVHSLDSIKDQDAIDLFDADADLYNDEEDEDEEDLDDEIVELDAVIQAKLPDLPAILFYDSKSHGKRRFYMTSLHGKPTWTDNKEEAYTFDNHDHLKLAGQNCKNYGYKGLDVETVQ
jgi:hypothetical protein